jgi:hypothetical protein
MLMGMINTPTKRQRFISSFIADLSTALEVPEDRCSVVAMVPGSIIVFFRIKPPIDGPLGELTPRYLPSQVGANLVKQVNDFDSQLRRGRLMKLLDPKM